MLECPRSGSPLIRQYTTFLVTNLYTRYQCCDMLLLKRGDLMHQTIFHRIVSLVIEELYAISRANPTSIATCKSGDDFELKVVEVVSSILQREKIDAIVHHTPGGHAFPDIIIEFADTSKYGIEVKSSSSAKSKGWKINGNSVMGSTRDPDVIETFIVFGKTAKSNQDFKTRRYEECVTNVVVTHSPRYLIDMDIPKGETFFDKSKIDYKTLADSENPIGLITGYFQGLGQKAWWLSNSTPAAVSMLRELSPSEQLDLFGYGLAHFPELFDASNTKYKRFALWLVTERSVISHSLRDDFSAGGQVDLPINGKVYHKLPQIFNRLMTYRGHIVLTLDQTDPETLAADWGIDWTPEPNRVAKLKAWIYVVSENIPERQLPDAITPQEILNDIFQEWL